ncbi:MAG TPA: hypothetical protein PLU50_07150 [Pseudobdellovibrionaceae bacterium]|nr:hypothetical protein [Pseudobdellovibrionaceae bacterium]
MDKSAIKAEISAQSKLVDAICIDQELVTEIDRHIKEVENQLNTRLVHIPAKVIIQNFLPVIDKRGTLATKVNEEVWDSFLFGKNWYAQKVLHEEISFERHSKGYGFFYTVGEVTFDLGVVECDGVDWYVRVLEDKRETHKLTGASVEIKLRAFQHLGVLLTQINHQAEQLASQFRADLSRDALERFPGMQIVGGLNRFFGTDSITGNR